MDKAKRQGREWLKALVFVALLAVAGWLVSTHFLRDAVYNITYHESAEVANIREDLLLTNKAKWIFGAAQPQLESREDFNQHCENKDYEVALLGCYVEGRIYVYQISDAELADANKATLAHELLHAAWSRMGRGEQERVEKLLREVQAENAAWFEAELVTYSDEMKLEEVWTRAGTKLENLPVELEQVYAKYFQNRKVIVAAYKNYEKPFLELQDKSEKLLAEVTKGVEEIEKEKAKYLATSQKLSEEIDIFNQCAEEEGCFKDEVEFERQREELLERRSELDKWRDEINLKVDENNAKVKQIEEYQMTLGEMNDALNSHATEKVK